MMKKKTANSAAKPKERATAEVVGRVIGLVAAGSSLRAASESVGMSHVSMLEAIERHGLADQYARACDARAEVIAEDLIQIADVGTGDVARDRLRYDARKWFASKLSPRRFGDKATVEHSGPDGGAIPIAAIDVTKLSEQTLKDLMRARREAATK